jgi:hypothetical protein
VDTFAVGLIGLRDSGIKPGSLALLGMTVLGLVRDDHSSPRFARITSWMALSASLRLALELLLCYMLHSNIWQG